ncbi:DUF86 domain-containing protein [Bacillaceae bacterium IKA-2]|nr:DUF86 domain-containing protein [Bacillaceae bacterium IKA-2]
MRSDVILNKVNIIERCLVRVQDVYASSPENLSDYTKQDSIVLNIQRACEASIDLAMHIIAENKLGIPQHSRDGFEILKTHQIITEKIAENMKAMVGFRNIAIHDYQTIHIGILQKIIENHLQDFKEFSNQIIKK